MKNLKDFFNTAFVIIICVLPFAILLFLIDRCDDRDYRRNNYCSEFEIHYIDGGIDTVYVTGYRSYEQEAGFFNGGWGSKSSGYYFYDIQGVCRVKLLNTDKSNDYSDRVKIIFKNK